jgi:hypothetical protein
MSIYVDQIDLSMADPVTGEYLTANVYSVEGVTNPDGSLRQLSIGQLVMALCLKNAAELETQIIQLMEVMNTTTAQLQAMTEIENTMIDYETNGDNAGWTLNHWHLSSDVPVYGGQGYDKFLHDLDIIDDDINWVYRNGNTPSVEGRKYISTTDLITVLESKMDEQNSFSQQKMIELQSLTNKRDQSYDMISNILKSLQTVLVGTVNNI